MSSCRLTPQILFSIGLSGKKKMKFETEENDREICEMHCHYFGAKKGEYTEYVCMCSESQGLDI
jgi:hypothetical protein